MLSTLVVQDELSKIFEHNSAVKEVYSTNDFSFNLDMPTFVVLHKLGCDTSLLFYKLQSLFDGDIKFYATSNTMDSLIQDKRIIWRHGKWYL